MKRKTMKLKLTGIALKRLQNATETQVAHRRVELSRSYLISFQYFKLLYTIITFPYKLYLHCVTQLSVILLKCSQLARSLGDLW